MVKFKIIKGGVTAPEEFFAAGLYSGIKKSKKKDLAVIFSKLPCTAAGMFTENKFKAAPIIVSQEQINNPFIQAIVANSGNANCGTGEQGLKDAWEMIKAAATNLGIRRESVLVTSTGVIGKPLPMKNILKGIKIACKKISRKGSKAAAEAILTTDKRIKEISLEMKLDTGKVRIGGIAKGSGMIYPNMALAPHATMHAFITTDAFIDEALLEDLLKDSVENSFNMVSIDRCMSTNDCVFILANSASGVKVKSTNDIEVFKEALDQVCCFLAREIARDGEGATKLLEVNVNNAEDIKQARKVALEVASSMLLKSAIFGGDPNLGRILSAVGQAGAEVDKTQVSINAVTIAKEGAILHNNLAKAAKKIKAKEIIIEIDLGLGFLGATSWGCDLTYDYVTINAKYHT